MGGIIGGQVAANGVVTKQGLVWNGTGWSEGGPVGSPATATAGFVTQTPLDPLKPIVQSAAALQQLVPQGTVATAPAVGFGASSAAANASQPVNNLAGTGPTDSEIQGDLTSILNALGGGSSSTPSSGGLLGFWQGLPILAQWGIILAVAFVALRMV